MSFDVFRITFEGADGRRLDRDSQQFEARLQEATRIGLEAAAVVIKRKLVQALGRTEDGGMFNVGATGRAARLWEIVSGRSGVGVQELQVKASEFYPAQLYIRTGTKGGGGMPPIEEIRRWMQAKQLQVRAPEDMSATGKLTSSKQVRYTKRSSRPWKRSEPLFERVSWIIAKSIQRKGMSVYSMLHRPDHAKYFDYLKWVAEQQHEWTKILDESAGELAMACVEFALYGKDAALLDFIARYRTYSRWGEVGRFE